LVPLVDVFTHALLQTVSAAAHITQLPPVQTAPATHWLAEVQLVTHAVAPQTNGLHARVTAAGHAPALLQPAMARLRSFRLPNFEHPEKRLGKLRRKTLVPRELAEFGGDSLVLVP